MSSTMQAGQATLFADQPDVMNVPMVAKLLGVIDKTIYREIARGNLECVRVGTRIRITKQQLLAYVTQGAA